MPVTHDNYQPIRNIYFNDWQRKAMRSKALILLLDGQAGSGKSFMMYYKIHLFMTRYAGANYLIGRKSYREMINSTILPFVGIAQALEPNIVYSSSNHRIEYPNGSVVFVEGFMDERSRQRIRSMNLDGAWLEEANQLTEDDFSEVLARMRGVAASWNQVILTLNPDSKGHWIYKRFILNQDPYCRRIYSTSDSNRDNLSRTYNISLDSMRGVRRQRLKEGIWVSSDGSVFPQFSYSTHVIEPFPIPDGWRRFRSIDFGTRSPFVCRWYAYNKEKNELYVYREIYETGLDPDRASEMILEHSQDEPISYTVADWDASARAVLNNRGIPTIRAKKDIKVGVAKLGRWLDINPSTQKPRLMFFDGMTVNIDGSLVQQKLPSIGVEEYDGYEWHPDAIKDIPLQVNDHAIDTDRYAVMSLENLGGQAGYTFLNKALPDYGNMEMSAGY